MAIELQYPLGSYSVDNPPSNETLKGDLTTIQTAVNVNETDIASVTASDALKAAATDVTALETVVNPASASAPASLDLHEDTDNGTNKITIIAPSAVASDKVLTLPDETGTLISSAGKASGAEITTGTNEAKFLTPKALADATVGKLGAAWTTGWAPTISAVSGTYTTASGAGSYIQIGKTVFYNLTITITDNGTAAGATKFTLPINSNAVAAVGCGRENAVTGKMLQVIVDSATIASIRDYAGAYGGGTGYTLIVSGTYEAA